MFNKTGIICGSLSVCLLLISSLDQPQAQQSSLENKSGFDPCDINQYPVTERTLLIQHIKNAFDTGRPSTEVLEEISKDYHDLGDFIDQKRTESSDDEVLLGLLQMTLTTTTLAEGGCVEFQVFLGAMANSAGNFQEALKWYKRAAEEGDAAAQYEVGRLYYLGRGIPQNYQEALKWLHLAADQRYDNAYVILGMLYSLAQGVPQDVIQAHVWANLAVASSHEEAKALRDELEGFMTTKQIAEAQRLAKEWMEKHQDGNQ